MSGVLDFCVQLISITEPIDFSVREAAMAVSEAYRSRPQTPVELSVWSIENVMKNGARRLEKSYGGELSLAVYYSWDVMLVFSAMIIGCLAAVLWISKRLSNLLGRKSRTGKKIKRS